MSNNGKPTALQTDKELATTAFESFLTPAEEGQVEEAGQTEVEEVIEEEEVSEETEELVEADEESDLDDEIDDEEQQEIEDDQEQPPLYAVRVDGQEIEVTLEELQNGYSRQQDYTRKTQELAQQRKTVEEQAQEVAQRDAIYSQLLPKMEAQIKGDLANEPDWNKLYEDDPVGYVREKQLWDEKKQKLQAVQAEQQRIQQEAYAKQQEQIAQVVQEGQQKLLEIIPEWQNPETAQQEKLAIREYGINVLGYTPQEMDAVYDYRALLGLRNAWLNSKTQQAVKKKPTEKAKARVARPGTTNRPKSVTPVRKAKQRLAKTGKPSDAAKVFEQMLK
mgnify:FL=1|jgi:hypothetical protein|tara:strand:- start:3621 stop:4622 length:1002 start_codon:yes stop_codon:yes gene_type:complete